jgi:hypothetical protein
MSNYLYLQAAVAVAGLVFLPLLISEVDVDIFKGTNAENASIFTTVGILNFKKEVGSDYVKISFIINGSRVEIEGYPDRIKARLTTPDYFLEIDKGVGTERYLLREVGKELEVVKNVTSGEVRSVLRMPDVYYEELVNASGKFAHLSSPINGIDEEREVGKTMEELKGVAEKGINATWPYVEDLLEIRTINVTRCYYLSYRDCGYDCAGEINITVRNEKNILPVDLSEWKIVVVDDEKNPNYRKDLAKPLIEYLSEKPIILKPGAYIVNLTVRFERSLENCIPGTDEWNITKCIGIENSTFFSERFFLVSPDGRKVIEITELCEEAK